MIMKMHSFQKKLLDHENFVSSMSLVSFCNDFEQPLQNNSNLFIYLFIFFFCEKIFTSLT